MTEMTGMTGMTEKKENISMGTAPVSRLEHGWIHPLQIGNLQLDNNVFLAPMAGTSELPFRKICRRMGAGLVFTELVTARGIRFQKNVDKNYRYLEISPEEFPVAIQLFGADPEDFKAAVSLIFEHPLLSHCSMIDINMGCPVPKVVKIGAGSALMKRMPLAADIIRATVNASPVPVSVKFRKGWNDVSINAVEFAKMCEDSGASMITVHGRTTSQMYSGKADWEIIRLVKQASGIPVIGNGDVDSPQTAAAMFEQTGVDGIMIGRAAQGNPWIFSRIPAALRGEDSWTPPSTAQKIEIMKEQLHDAVAQMGEITAVKEMRKHFTWYLKGMPGACSVKTQIMGCNEEKEIIKILDEFAMSAIYTTK